MNLRHHFFAFVRKRHYNREVCGKRNIPANVPRGTSDEQSSAWNTENEMFHVEHGKQPRCLNSDLSDLL